MRLSRGLQITYASKLATMLLNIMSMEVHIHKHSLHWASNYSMQIYAPLRAKVNFFAIKTISAQRSSSKCKN